MTKRHYRFARTVHGHNRSQNYIDEKGCLYHCHTFYKYIQPNWHTDGSWLAALQAIVKDIKRAGEVGTLIA